MAELTKEELVLPMEEKEEEEEKQMINGISVNSRISVKLFDTSKSLFKRLSEDYDDKYENARKLQAFIDAVVPGEEQSPFIALSRFLGLLPPWNTDGLTDLRRFSRQDRMRRQRSQRSIDAPEPDTSSFSELFKHKTVDEDDDKKENEGVEMKRMRMEMKKTSISSPPGLFSDDDQPCCSNVFA